MITGTHLHGLLNPNVVIFSQSMFFAYFKIRIFYPVLVSVLKPIASISITSNELLKFHTILD